MRSLTLIAAVVCALMINSIANSQATIQKPTNVQTGNTAAQQQALRSPITPQTKAMAPDWYAQLSNDHNQFLYQLLDLWQSKSDDVKRYHCQFNRYDYDTTFCNWRDPKTNQLAAATLMQGEIRFASPDKASYETVSVFDFAGPPKVEGGEAQYKARDTSTNREKWICDGTAIHEYDFENKKLYETNIPAEMQGKGLVNSPIPFLFGASKEDILNRFWVRIITPNNVKNEYWLEAVPKRIEDARNYKKLELVLSRDELFLPIMLHVYAPNYNPKENNFTSRIFEFNNRKVNDRLTGFQNFLGMFVRPSTPIGWERVKRKGLEPYQQFDPSTLTRPAQNNTGRRLK
jgi:TIGR03009 family protein